MDLEKITYHVINLARRNGQWIKQQVDLFNAGDIEVKEEHNYVTYVDRQSEEMLVNDLMNLTPGCGFLAEEGDYGNAGSDIRWIIDPLDGTTNFIHRVPFFAISIGLMIGDEMVAGIVHEINRQETFYSWKGGKAFADGKEIRVSEAATLANSLLVTGFPYSRDHILDRYVDLFKGFIRRTQDLRRLGSAATDLAYVASGRFEGFYEYGLNPWDVAAGSFLVKQAGGQVTDFSGGSDYIFGQTLVSSNSQVHWEMIDTIREYFMNEQH